MAKNGKGALGAWGEDEVGYIYTRAQAIEDGVLVDVSETAAEAGFKWPVAVTRALWDGYIVPDAGARGYGQSEGGRLWDVLWLLRQAIKPGRAGGPELRFAGIFVMKRAQRRLVELKALVGPGDDGQPVITVMLPGED